jgi:hypothetical protein
LLLFFSCRPPSPNYIASPPPQGSSCYILFLFVLDICSMNAPGLWLSILINVQRQGEFARSAIDNLKHGGFIC